MVHVSHPRELWSWDRCRDAIRSLRGRKGFPLADRLGFLAYSLDLSTGELYDELDGRLVERGAGYAETYTVVYFLLDSYGRAPEVQLRGEWFSPRQFPGVSLTSRSYQGLARQVTRGFAADPSLLGPAAQRLGGSPVEVPVGDQAYSIPALPQTPVTIVYNPAGEFPAETHIYFDSSITQVFDSEQAFFLALLTVKRLLKASKALG